MNKCTERLYNGLIKENPTFVMMLGMCPTLAVTSSLQNGFGMGMTTMVVLTASNAIISLLRKVIPDKVRMPAFIVIVASFVTIVQFMLEAYLPSLNASLGIYIPLIVVNCIILGRAEAYASKNPVLPSIFDGIGMGLGFTFGLSCLGFFRELVGSGTVLSHRIIPDEYCIKIIGLAPGAFFVLAVLVAVQNKIRLSKGKEPKELKCVADCSACKNQCDERGKDFAGSTRQDSEKISDNDTDKNINREMSEDSDKKADKDSGNVTDKEANESAKKNIEKKSNKGSEKYAGKESGKGSNNKKNTKISNKNNSKKVNKEEA